MRSGIRRIAGLRPGEWVALPLLVLASVAAAVALRFLSLGRLTRLAYRLGRVSGFPCGYPMQRLYDVADLASRMTHGHDRCLPRSLLLVGLVKSRPELLVGVARSRSILESHAWVERGGLVVGDSPEVADRFAELFRFSSP